MLLLKNAFVLNSNFSWFLALGVVFSGRVGHKSTGFIVRLEFFILGPPLPVPSSFPGPPRAPTPVLSSPRSRLHLSQRVGRSAGTPVLASLPGTPGSLVGPIERGKEYQLKGYEYLRAELFNNIRVGGPWDSQDESCGMINVTRHHKRQECAV